MDQGWDPEGSGIVSTLGRLGRRLNGTEILPFAARDSVPRLLRPAPAPRLGGRRGRVCRPVRFSLQTVEHGFPHQPSALGYSPCLRILAIGTRSGAVKLYPSVPVAPTLGSPGRGGDLGISEVREGPPPSRKKNVAGDPSYSRNVPNSLSGVRPECSKQREVVGQESFLVVFFFLKPSQESVDWPQGSVQTRDSSGRG